ncbi:hypothetical protein ACFQU7_37480 [Pseudoroseomonas wenyumeiae]
MLKIEEIHERIAEASNKGNHLAAILAAHEAVLDGVWKARAAR